MPPHEPGPPPPAAAPPVVRFLTQHATPADQLLLFANGQRLAAALHVVTRLDIATLLADGERDVEALAQETGSHAPSLQRVLRCTALAGVFAESAPGRFSLTPAAELLRSDRSDSLRPVVLLDTSAPLARALSRLTTGVREGGRAFAQEYGIPFSAPPNERVPEEVSTARALYEEVTTALSRDAAAQCLASHQELGGFDRIADLAGGDGQFLRELLCRRPEATGVLVDSAARSATALGTTGTPQGLETSPRLETVAVDPLGPAHPSTMPTPPAMPQDCDLYLLRAVLHTFSDEAAADVLRRVRQAIGKRKARLVVLDHVVASGDGWDPAKILDIDMLAVYGGLCRDAAQWRRLFQEAGFTMVEQRDLAPGQEPPGHGADAAAEPAAWSLLVARPTAGTPPSGPC
ncbi:methyltransferase [Streptomyces sp. 891-h]|uniref:methyltransferase n=1 Tax=unclassified Streptomyces TaxID=2593676 RepID=UPI001FA9F4B7|nr:methyltransferase [Streptomyces sp. 891-h]UNZ21042.1 hypothetical protein HC362_32105 [Streptomyces sp. 891-h]